MSIYIKGMEMPEVGEHILSLHVYHDGTASIIGRHRYYKKEPFEAIAVPPHGRLIDADEITEHDHQHYEYLTDTFYVTVRDIELAPTIIEAEGVDADE